MTRIIEVSRETTLFYDADVYLVQVALLERGLALKTKMSSEESTRMVDTLKEDYHQTVELLTKVEKYIKEIQEPINDKQIEFF